MTSISYDDGASACKFSDGGFGCCPTDLKEHRKHIGRKLCLLLRRKMGEVVLGLSVQHLRPENLLLVVGVSQQLLF